MSVDTKLYLFLFLAEMHQEGMPSIAHYKQKQDKKIGIFHITRFIVNSLLPIVTRQPIRHGAISQRLEWKRWLNAFCLPILVR